MRAAKVDANQPEIVKALKALNFAVYYTHTVGGDFPDLVVARDGFNVLVEIKQAKGKLSKGQLDWHQNWPGWVVVIKSVEDCERLSKIVDNEKAARLRGIAEPRMIYGHAGA